MSIQLTTSLKFTVMECNGCGVIYALTDEFINVRKSKNKGFRCPNGCERIFCDKTREENLKEQLKRERLEREHAQGLFEAERNSHRTTRGHITRIKKRVSAGVCPCCKRTFEQLARHMKSKHPKYQK